MKKSLLIAFTLVLLGAGAVWAQNSIAVTNAAAMGPANGGTACSGGMCGLEVIFPGGSVNPAKVVDDTPIDEAPYRAVFWFDPTGLTPNPSATGQFYVLMRATELTSFKSAFMLLLTQKFNLYRLSGRAATNAAGVFRITNRIDLTGPNRIQVEFTQSPTPGVPGGDVVITVLEGPQAGQVASVTLFTGGTGVNNSSINVDDLHMGAVGNISTLITGSAYYDEFESYRTLAP